MGNDGALVRTIVFNGRWIDGGYVYLLGVLTVSVSMLVFFQSPAVSRILLVSALLHDSTRAIDSRKATGAMAGPRREVSYAIQIEDVSGT